MDVIELAKDSFRFFCKILQKTLNESLGQYNIYSLLSVYLSIHLNINSLNKHMQTIFQHWNLKNDWPNANSWIVSQIPGLYHKSTESNTSTFKINFQNNYVHQNTLSYINIYHAYASARCWNRVGHWAAAVSGEDTPFCHGDAAQTVKNLPAIQETRVQSLD